MLFNFYFLFKMYFFIKYFKAESCYVDHTASNLKSFFLGLPNSVITDIYHHLRL